MAKVEVAAREAHVIRSPKKKRPRSPHEKRRTPKGTKERSRQKDGHGKKGNKKAQTKTGQGEKYFTHNFDGIAHYIDSDQQHKAQKTPSGKSKAKGRTKAKEKERALVSCEEKDLAATQCSDAKSEKKNDSKMNNSEKNGILDGSNENIKSKKRQKLEGSNELAKSKKNRKLEGSDEKVNKSNKNRNLEGSDDKVTKSKKTRNLEGSDEKINKSNKARNLEGSDDKVSKSKKTRNLEGSSENVKRTSSKSTRKKGEKEETKAKVKQSDDDMKKAEPFFGEQCTKFERTEAPPRPAIVTDPPLEMILDGKPMSRRSKIAAKSYTITPANAKRSRALVKSNYVQILRTSTLAVYESNSQCCMNGKRSFVIDTHSFLLFIAGFLAEIQNASNAFLEEISVS